MGGEEKFLDRLDYIWDKEYADIGDEVGFLVSNQYGYAKRGYQRTVDRTLDNSLKCDNGVTHPNKQHMGK